MAVSACVSVFVALFVLDCVDLVSVVAFNIVIRVAAVKEILEEEGSNRLVSSSILALAPSSLVQSITNMIQVVGMFVVYFHLGLSAQVVCAV